MNDDKEIRWVGSSYDDLLAFPQEPQATSKQDKTVAEARYRAVLNARKTDR